MSVETSLILFKPDAIEKKIVGAVLQRFEAAGLTIRGVRMLALDDAVLQEHYAHIADQPFFPKVAAFMKKTPVIALALEGENAISQVRDLLGPTDSRKAAKGTIRGDYGEDMMVNVCHASDGPETAAAEIKRFFGEDGIFQY